MKKTLIVLILFTLTSCTFLFGEKKPNDTNLQKNLRIPRVIDETHELKLVDFITIPYPNAEFKWKKNGDTDWYLEISYKDEMRNSVNRIKYHLDFKPDYVDLLAASMNDNVISQQDYSAVFPELVLSLARETGNKKILRE